MAVGFTSRERENITKALLEAAGRHAAMGGMRKTSVDELCAEAGISKGAFYSFFPSKEHLFLTVMERWQEEISRHAEEALRQAGELDGPGRASLMMKTACRAMRQKSMERFLQEDMPLILRKLPQLFHERLIERQGLGMPLKEKELLSIHKISSPCLLL